MEERLPRKLAAILHADVAGYSRLAGEDEDTTHRTLTASLELISGLITSYHGRVINTAGDAVLAMFDAVTDALSCAVAMQRDLASMNEELSKDRKVQYRIGVNLGDVIEDKGDIFGDGVNVAARLEGLAEPGGICISESVYTAVGNKLPLDYTDLGEQEVKNISGPVRAYNAELISGQRLPLPSIRKNFFEFPGSWPWLLLSVATLVIASGIAVWVQPWKTGDDSASVMHNTTPIPDKPSIVVLPFDNLSDDSQQEYFSDGMTEDLTTDLSRIPNFFVISRNSAFTYKGRALKPQQIADELGVRYILEGSVRRVGDMLRINAQLIDSAHGGHLWANRYDGTDADIFAFQDQVISAIVSSLEVQLTDIDAVDADEFQTSVPEAYDVLLRGFAKFRKGSKKDVAESIKLFNHAATLDPEYMRAYAALAEAYWHVVDKGWSDILGLAWGDVFELVEKNLDIALQSENSDAYRVSAKLKLYHGQYADALDIIDKAIAIAPSDSKNYVAKAQILIFAGQPEASEKNTRLAIQLDPHIGSESLLALGRAMFYQGRYEEAATISEQAIAANPEDFHNYIVAASSFGHLGQRDKALEFVEKYNKQMIGIGYHLSMTVQEVGYWQEDTLLFKDASIVEPMFEGLRIIGVPEGAAPQTKDFDFKSLVSGPAGAYQVEGATRIDTESARKLNERGAVFIDVRDHNSYKSGHVPGAINLDLTHELTRSNLLENSSKDGETVFYCWGIKCSYSALACAKAVLWGYENVYYFAGGFPGWRDAGYEISKLEF